jgi:hypothetical protein
MRQVPPNYNAVNTLVISAHAVEHRKAPTTAIAFEAIMAVGVRTAR